MWEFVEIYLTYEGCLSVWSYYEYCWSELLHTQCFFFFFYFQVEEVGLMVPSITLKSLLRVDLLKKHHLYFMGYEITKKKKLKLSLMCGEAVWTKYLLVQLSQWKKDEEKRDALTICIVGSCHFLWRGDQCGRNHLRAEFISSRFESAFTLNWKA